MIDTAMLRQVMVATADLAGDGKLLRERFGLGAGWSAPALTEMGLAGDTMALGGGVYLELLSPLSPDSGLGRRLAKYGPGGFGLAVQHSDPLAARDRALAHKVRVILDDEVEGRHVVQLHPADLGLMLELDGDGAFWDGLAAPASDALVDDLVRVDVGVPDPTAAVTLWSAILDIEPLSWESIDIGGRVVHFHPAAERPQWTLTLSRTADDVTDTDLAGLHVHCI